MSEGHLSRFSPDICPKKPSEEEVAEDSNGRALLYPRPLYIRQIGRMLRDMGSRGRKGPLEATTSPVRLVAPSPPVELLPAPPQHLSAAMQSWWNAVVRDYELESHHLRLLELAADCWDRLATARAELLREGLTITTASGTKQHPAVAIERDARLAFARLIRELDLDCPAPPPGPYRPPAIRSNRRR
jgi:hypothetical protein